MTKFYDSFYALEKKVNELPESKVLKKEENLKEELVQIRTVLVKQNEYFEKLIDILSNKEFSDTVRLVKKEEREDNSDPYYYIPNVNLSGMDIKEKKDISEIAEIDVNKNKPKNI